MEELNIENKSSVLNEDIHLSSSRKMSKEYQDQCFDQNGLIAINEHTNESDGFISNPDFQSIKLHSSNRRMEEMSSKTSNQLREASSDKKKQEMNRDIVTPIL